MNLSAKDIHTFFDRGYIVLKGLFSRPEVEGLRGRALEVYKNSMTFGRTGEFNNSRVVFSGDKIHRVVWCGGQDSAFLEVGSDRRILRPVGQLLKSNECDQIINQLHFKFPGDGVAFPYHQDSENRGYGTRVWNDMNGKGSYVQTTLAIDPMTLDNGPMEFIPGSCKLGHLGLDRNPSLLEKMRDKLEKPVPLELDPGDVALFGPYTIHGSRPNRSVGPRGSTRIVLINGYALPGANSREYPGCGKGVRHVSGEDSL